jgi:hypothetical protein
MARPIAPRPVFPSRSAPLVPLVGLAVAAAFLAAACAGAPPPPQAPAEPVAAPSAAPAEPVLLEPTFSEVWPEPEAEPVLLAPTLVAESPEPAPEPPPPPVYAAFRAEAFAAPAVPPGLGLAATAGAAALPPGERAAAVAAFRAAFRAAALRGADVAGALGGDKIHRWTPTQAAVQNWRSAAKTADVWGLPGLVLAVAAPGGRAYPVRGVLLDAYGRGEGRGGNAGVVGYGAPLSEDYRFYGSTAQRFEYGLLVVSPAGRRRFLEEPPPSTLVAAPAELGVLVATTAAPPGLSLPTAAGLRAAFRQAWNAAADRYLSGLAQTGADGRYPAVPADGPAVLAAPPAAAGAAPAGLIVQTFAGGAFAIVLAVGDGATGEARLVAGVFVKECLAAGGWESGFARLGAPESDPLWLDDGRMAQVFSKGRLEEFAPGPPAVPSEEPAPAE